MIPNPTYYPNQIDTDDNLFLVKDSLRVKLIEDYKPGDNVIFIEENDSMSKFPPTGIITLTEQCSDIDKRAISFYYKSKTNNSFNELEILPEFDDVVKPKIITNVTMNVLDKHHNHLKDSLIEIQKFLGTKKNSLEETITSRINFIKKVAYKPRPWFIIDKTIGLIPLKVNFKNESLRTKFVDTKYKWETKLFDSDDWEEIGSDVNSVEYTYIIPGVYDVRLTATNEYGMEFVEFKESITARINAPEEAVINIVPSNSQKLLENNKIRSLTNSFIKLEIQEGINPDNSDYTYLGELVSGAEILDKVKTYTWDLGDDLIHSNSRETRASYSIGGYYNIVLRVDTEFGSYRITNYENAIDIIENQNLWIFNIKDQQSNLSGNLEAWEFGLTSETFKKLGNQTTFIDRNSSFLNEYKNNPYRSNTYNRAIKEFFKNTEFAQQGSLSSGERGNCLFFWASGGSEEQSILDHKINIKKYNAFEDVYSPVDPIPNKPWNWISLVSNDNVYFLLGQSEVGVTFENYARPFRTDYNLLSQSFSDEISLSLSNFENGAENLLNYPSYFDDNSGIPTNGRFATYRSTWKDSSGYFLRNASVNEFFRISEFYKTSGTLSNEFNNIVKLPDMTGSVKTEGELVNLSSGVFFFNNSGEISAWNDVSLTWETGRASSSSLSFRSLQDSNISDFENRSNSLLAASDGDSIVYLSYDYSKNAFIKFNSIDLTFSRASNSGRPVDNQLKLGIY
jgi:PKD repeat protein